MDLDRIPDIAKYLSLVFLVSWIGRATVWNFLPIFIEEQISSVFLVGVVTSLPALIPLITDIPVGNLVQRSGEKIVIFVGLAAAILPPVMYYTAAAPFIVLGKTMEGVVKSLVWNGGWSLSLQASDEDVESESVSVFLLGVNVAYILGPIVGGYLLASYGFNLTFRIWAFSALLGLALFYFYIGLGRDEADESLEESVEDLFHRSTYSKEWRDLKENWSELRLPYSLIFLYSIIFSFYWLAIPLLLERMGADLQMMGIIFGIAAVPKSFQFIFGELADRRGKLKVLSALSILIIPVLAVMNFVSDLMMIGGLVLVARTLSSGMSPVIHAVYDERVPDDIESEMTSFMEFFKHAGTAIGPVLAGAVASIWSINESFLAASLVGATIFMVTWMGSKNYL
ncbi:MFS transporter [Candidatus Nanohalovita haloferacivicina]|uniref:MFS transporter n=1 Tax=Candidatus Nanohalovita haloferacivicina TaxID=2978046 RepID=UPI00325FDC7A|nr:Major facilitator superfamily MFS_1 [Candidatus Nanohalobia archaeon BNXNv]